MKRVALLFACLGAGSIFLLPALAPARAHGTPHVCQGTSSKPGVLKGRFVHGVRVEGFCEVNSGPAHVIGTVQVTDGSALIAVFGMHKSKLSVSGDIRVGHGG